MKGWIVAIVFCFSLLVLFGCTNLVPTNINNNEVPAIVSVKDCGIINPPYLFNECLQDAFLNCSPAKAITMTKATEKLPDTCEQDFFGVCLVGYSHSQSFDIGVTRTIVGKSGNMCKVRTEYTPQIPRLNYIDSTCYYDINTGLKENCVSTTINSN